MPIYEYQCTLCEHKMESLQKMSDDPLKDCPACDRPALKKLVSAASFRLKGKGMSILRSSARGDMFVQAMVETPVNLTARQKELLKEFDSESATETHSPQAHGFFGKVRELWEDLKE